MFKLIGCVFKILFIGLFLFIKSSNNHIECGTDKNSYTNKKGEKVTVIKHVCREKYKF